MLRKILNPRLSNQFSVYHADWGGGWDIEMRRGGDMQRANLGGWWDTLLCLPPVYRRVWCTILVDGHPVCIVCLLCTVEYLQYLNLTVGHHVRCPHSVAWFGQLWYGIVYHILVWFGVYPTKWDTNQTVNVPVTQQKVTSNKKKNKQQSSMQQFTSPPL